MMSPTLEQLTEQFTQLIGPEAFAQAAAAQAAAKPAPAPAPAAAPAGASPATPAAPVAPRPAPVPAAPPPPASPLLKTDFALKGWHLDATVASSQVVAAAQIVDRAGFSLDTITGVDWIAQNEMEVVYDFFHATSPLRVVVRARVPRDNPELPTITPVYAGANWHEREAHDMFGLRFAGHPNLKPFLLPEDADYHPLRKDFKL
jgi:NADH-quinone oxidoreductase subunit C